MHMHIDISKSCSDHLRELYKKNTGNKLKPTHARELIAAYFGYKSHASLLFDKEYNIQALLECDILAPDLLLFNNRRQQLQDLPGDLDNTYELAQSISNHLKNESGFKGKVLLNESLELCFIEDFIPNHTSDFDDQLSGIMADMNAEFDDFPYVESAVCEDNGSNVILTTEGTYEGTPFDDKPYSGHKINFTATLSLRRIATRRGFSKDEFEINGSEADDYRDMENTLSGGMILDEYAFLDGGPAVRPKDHFINVTGGFRFGESPAMFELRLKAIADIRKKVSQGSATYDDVSRLSELTGSEDEDWN